MLNSIEPYLPSWIVALIALDVTHALVGLLLLTLLGLLARRLTLKLLLPLLHRLIRRTSFWWDDVLVQRSVFERLVILVPLLLVHLLMPLVPGLSAEFLDLALRLLRVCMLLAVLRAFTAMTGAINDIYARTQSSRGRSIKGVLQAVVILTWILGGIVIVATLSNQSPWYFLSGLGAMTAILLLVFRDTLLSLVAGVQITSTDVIRMGDWIEMPQFGADGDVVDISLHQVRIENWDKTITVIPTHKFLEHSFKNWRRMFEAGGRRIKRSIFLDMTTVRFVSDEEMERFARFAVLKDYIADKKRALEQWNQAQTEEPLPANRRRLTNVGTFRAYLIGYLRRHPCIHQELTFLVRQLQPTAEGLPMEIYVFTNDTRWAEYEGIQADIFDHVLAMLPEFGLRVFQSPAGSDIQRAGHALAEYLGSSSSASSGVGRLP